MNNNAAFNNGDEALAHLRQFGSQPLGAWFARLLQTAPQVAAQQQQSAQNMTAQAPAMAASDPFTAQDEHSKLAQLAAEQSAPGDYNQAPSAPPMPPMMGEGGIDSGAPSGPGMGAGAPSPRPSPQPAPQPSPTMAGPSSGMGPGNLQGGSAPTRQTPDQRLTGRANGYLDFFQKLFGAMAGGAASAGAQNLGGDIAPGPPGSAQSGPPSAPYSGPDPSGGIDVGMGQGTPPPPARRASGRGPGDVRAHAQGARSGSTGLQQLLDGLMGQNSGSFPDRRLPPSSP